MLSFGVGFPVDALDRRAALVHALEPTASPIGFPLLRGVEDTAGFCEQLVIEAGVLLLPGTVYDEPGHVRVGFGRANMPEALERLERWLLDTRS